MPTLVWERRDGGRTVFQLLPGETTLGRDPANPIRIESEYVSKRHAAIRAGQQGCTITDLGSSNGTSVNGRRVTASILRDGDRIDLGAEVLKFSGDAATAAAPAGRRRSPVVVAGIVGGGLVVVALLVRLMMTGSSTGEPRGDAGSPNTPLTTGRPAEAEAQAGQPAATDVPSAPVSIQEPPGAPPPAEDRPAQPPAPSAPRAGVGGTVPAGGSALPLNDPAALYDLAMSHVKGGRLVEARRLLIASLRLDPRNAPARQRLQEVDATIEAKVDRHLADGQRAFTYLRYQDAILEWEQALSMTNPSDPRHQQAATGIQRARERLRR